MAKVEKKNERRKAKLRSLGKEVSETKEKTKKVDKK
jgi:hypothetical protein